MGLGSFGKVDSAESFNALFTSPFGFKFDLQGLLDLLSDFSILGLLKFILDAI